MNELQQLQNFRSAWDSAAPGTFNLSAALDSVGLNPHDERDGDEVVQAVKSGGKSAGLRKLDTLIESYREVERMDSGELIQCAGCGLPFEMGEVERLDGAFGFDEALCCSRCTADARRESESETRYARFMASPAGKARKTAFEVRREQERIERESATARRAARPYNYEY